MRIVNWFTSIIGISLASLNVATAAEDPGPAGPLRWEQLDSALRTSLEEMQGKYEEIADRFVCREVRAWSETKLSGATSDCNSCGDYSLVAGGTPLLYADRRKRPDCKRSLGCDAAPTPESMNFVALLASPLRSTLRFQVGRSSPGALTLSWQSATAWRSGDSPLEWSGTFIIDERKFEIAEITAQPNYASYTLKAREDRHRTATRFRAWIFGFVLYDRQLAALPRLENLQIVFAPSSQGISLPRLQRYSFEAHTASDGDARKEETRLYEDYRFFETETHQELSRSLGKSALTPPATTEDQRSACPRSSLDSTIRDSNWEVHTG